MDEKEAHKLAKFLEKELGVNYPSLTEGACVATHNVRVD